MNSNIFYCHIVFWQEAYCRLIYLLDVHIIEPEDMELNSTVFLWPLNILHVFELNDEVMLLCLLTAIQYYITVLWMIFKDDLILDSFVIF